MIECDISTFIRAWSGLVIPIYGYGESLACRYASLQRWKWLVVWNAYFMIQHCIMCFFWDDKNKNECNNGNFDIFEIMWTVTKNNIVKIRKIETKVLEFIVKYIDNLCIYFVRGNECIDPFGVNSGCIIECALYAYKTIACFHPNN